jgi:hypothetical protein
MAFEDGFRLPKELVTPWMGTRRRRLRGHAPGKALVETSVALTEEAPLQKGGTMDRREGDLTTQDLVSGATERREGDVVDLDEGRRYPAGEREDTVDVDRERVADDSAVQQTPGAVPMMGGDAGTKIPQGGPQTETQQTASEGGREAGFEPLLGSDETDNFQSRWQGIQAAFVDEPRRATEDADRLVAELMTRLAETFSEERSKLEGAWGQGEEVSTEDLRVALQRYRSFFNRLLSV